MIEIVVKVCGDHWLNPEEVEQQLAQISNGACVLIKMEAEGASVTAIGLRSMLDRYITPDRVYVGAWANGLDLVPYQRVDSHACSHFFWMAQRYWDGKILPATHQYRFACLIGRVTWPRLRMLMDLRQHHTHQCLLSLMAPAAVPGSMGRNLDHRNQWFTPAEDPLEHLLGLTSVDGHQVRDQYDPTKNTNLSILAHYHRFDIEIVAESYCHGPCYFPTEKSIRPLACGKPMMVYGPRYFLRNLRDQGFQTWGDWWDESYDDLEGPDRWQAMLEQIKLLSRCDHFDMIDRDCRPVLEHNRTRVREIAKRYQPQ